MRNGLFVMMAFMILCISLFNIFSLNCSSEPAGWSEDIRLTNNTNNSVIPVIGVYENYIHIFWCEQIPGPGSEYDIFYKRSTEGGKSWEATKKLIDTDQTLSDLSVAVNQNTTHLVWWDGRSGSDAIYYTKSNDFGENWDIEKNISRSSSWVQDPDIVVTGNDTYVTFVSNVENTNGAGQIFFTKSDDNGENWTPPKRLISTIRDSSHPAIAINGSEVHIVWMDHYDRFGTGTMGAIFYINSSDDGLTWSEDFNLTPMNLDATFPYITVNESLIHVVYSKEIAGLWQGYYRRSEDNGITWTGDIKIMDPLNDLFIDDFVMEANRLYVVGGEAYIPDEEIYFVKSINNGQSWGDDVRFTNYSEDSQQANIAVYNNKLYVVWVDYREGNPEIYFKYYPFYPPPTNLTIDIWGTNLTLNWTAPQTGLSPVDHYLIYRSTTWDGFNFAFPWANTSVDDDNGIIPLRTSWNDSIALLDESNNYYYVIRAVYENGEIDSNKNIVGKYMIPLSAGWNLISIPLAQNDTRTSEVLKSIDGTYNIVQWYDAKGGIWRSSLTGLTDINRTMGLWIHMKDPYNLSVVGAVPESTDVTLYEGWNLVGYPSLKTRNLNDALSGISWQAVQHYDAFDSNDYWKHNSTNKPDNLNDLITMEPGRGYWVYVTINDTWTSTRMAEENKIVVWRVHGLEREIDNQYNYEPLTNKPIDSYEDNYNQIDIVPEIPINKNENDRLNLSFIPLIILITFVFAEIILLHKRRR